MSGEQLRQAAIHNEVEELRAMLAAKANSCSADANGLTALHFAVWNGHVECVKYLAVNNLGVDGAGRRGSSLSMTSSLGYTALHLAAVDCPLKSVTEIATALLLSGINLKVRDIQGLTAYELAKQRGNTAFVDVYQSYVKALKGQADVEVYRNQLIALKKKYSLAVPRRPDIAPDDLEAQRLVAEYAGVKEVSVVKRTGERPECIKVQEHLIKPLAEYGYFELQGAAGLRCLRFADRQAAANLQRLEGILRNSPSGGKSGI